MSQQWGSGGSGPPPPPGGWGAPPGGPPSPYGPPAGAQSPYPMVHHHGPGPLMGPQQCGWCGSSGPHFPISRVAPAGWVVCGVLFFFFLPLQYVLVGIEWYGLYSIAIPVYAFLTLPIFAALSADLTRFFERTSKLQFALMVCVYCISHVPALMTLRIPGFAGGNILLIAWLVLVVQGSDVLQYVWGKLAGRRKIAPELSPSKTLEGFAGGVASATLLGSMLAWLTPFAAWQAAVIALVVCLMGFFGGLVMSAMKRDRGVKDWGTLIEGHGGMLDRLDSVIFAAPVYFHVIRYWWQP